MPYDETTRTHAMCDAYGHDWKIHTLLTSKAPANYRVQVCKRNNCDAARRVHVGR